MIKTISVDLLNSEITMEHAKTLLELESTGFLSIPTDKPNSGSELTYALFKEGYTFRKFKGMYEFYLDKTKIFKDVSWGQGFAKVTPNVHNMLLIMKQRMRNGIVLFPDRFVLIYGKLALGKEKIIEELRL